MRMKKSRWKKWLLWSLAIVVVVGVSGLFAANYAVNKVIDSMANSMLDDIDLEPTADESWNAAVDQQTPIDEKTMKEPDVTNEPDGTAADLDGNVESQTDKQKPLVQDPSKHATDAPGQQADNNRPAGKLDDKKADTDQGEKYSPNVSVDKAKAIQEKVTTSEKAKVASILLGNLEMSDIKLFKELASGGLSVDEKRKARKVLLDKLSPEEYNALVKIASKYGVSQGKTYDEIKKQEEGSAEK